MKSKRTTIFFAALAAVPILAFGIAQTGLFAQAEKRNGAGWEVGEEEEEMTHAGEAVAWRNLSLKDEKGIIPKGARKRALDQRLENIAYTSRTSPKFAELDRPDWVLRGPLTVGGRTRAISIDPTNTNIILAGSVSGGLWRSTDRGVTWSPVNDYMANLSISSIVRDPANPQVLYAGTGEGHFNWDAIDGAGVFKSTDGGVTWAQLPGSLGYESFNRIAINPTNSNILLASTRFGGIVRSTNAGASWTVVRAAQGSYDVEFHPTNGSIAVGEILDFSGTWFHRAVFSLDGGVTWSNSTGLSPVANFESRIDLAFAPSNPATVYASVATAGGVIYKSTGHGASFVQVTTGGNTTGADWYNNSIWVSPNDPNFLIVTGVSAYRSLDGGATVTQMGNGYASANSPHPDMHYVVQEPGYNGTTNRTIYLGTDGGIYRTADALNATPSSGWTDLNVGGYVTTQFYGAQGAGTTIMGGTQDNGTFLIKTSPASVQREFGGDGGWCAVDPTDANYLYGEYIYLQIHRSTNGGASAAPIWSGITDTGGNANFIAPFVLDPNDPNRILGGGASLWRSNNVKTTTPTWASIRAPGTDFISAIAIAKGNSNIVWVAQNDGKVVKTINGLNASPTWTDVDNNGAANPFPNRYVTRIFIDPANSNVVYVALGGFNNNNLWMTTNGGTSWTDITGSGVSGLPDVPIRGITRHPDNPDWLYVGTEVGIFSSETRGNTWSSTNDGPSSVSVDELSFMTNTKILLAATHGRGIWTADLSSQATTVTNLTLTPNSVPIGTGTTGTVTISPAAGTDGKFIALSASSAAATVPAYVKVLSGQTTANFAVTTAAPPATTSSVTITAKYGSSNKTALLTIVAPLNAEFVSQNVPAAVLPGATFSASVTMKNTGTDTWSEASLIRMMSQNPVDNATWGFKRFFILGGATVAPGANYTFTRNFTAPSTPGTYNFQWRMHKEGVGNFGPQSTNVAIVVPSLARDARFVSQVVPATIGTGQTFTASVTMTNMGTETWSEAAQHRLQSQNPFDNANWTYRRFFIAGATTVPTGGSYTFTRSFVAPSTPGNYNFQWRMTKEGSGNFGMLTVNKVITVIQRDAQFISQTVPSSVVHGATFSASITMKNLGTETWSEANGFRMMSQNPVDNATWGYKRIFIPGATTVAPNANHTFTRNFVAPATPGTYNFQWRMHKEGVGNFGQITVNVVITVT